MVIGKRWAAATAVALGLGAFTAQAAEPDEDPSQWADPASVTDVFVYLASNESAEVTGQRFLAQEEDEVVLKAS